MTTFASNHSTVSAMTDLDAFSMIGSDYSYPIPPQNYSAACEDFGFDPISDKFESRDICSKPGLDSPPDENDALNAFSFDPVKVEHKQSPDLNKLQHMQSSLNSVIRHGQVTPPRSNSESPTAKAADTKTPRQRRSTKTVEGEELQKQSTTTSRKRRTTRKSSTATNSNPEEDEKRKQSLEKNRLAAAKCRVNKKEKTEQLQRDSHDKACQNAFLKEQVMRMKEEIQQMNALLLQHANHQGCKSPDDISSHLNNLSHDFYPSHLGLSHDFAGFAGMADMDQSNYFSPTSDPSLMNPPLPDFDRDDDFDVGSPLDSSPMHTD